MSKLEHLEREVERLSPDELADFRRWFAAFDAAQWDQQLEQDVQSGKLNALSDEALAEHANCRARSARIPNTTS